MDYDHVSKIACVLTFRHRNNPEISDKLRRAFGDNYLTMCGRDSSFGEDSRHLLTVFWQEQIEATPALSDMAGKLHDRRLNPRKGFGRTKGVRGKSVGMSRPGTLLAWMISQVAAEKPCPVCSARAKEMNNKGWLWCWTNRKTIIGWLVEEAGKRGVVISTPDALGLLKAAFKEANQARGKD